MEFSEFAKKLKGIVGKSDTVEAFVKTIFETMVEEDWQDALEECGDETRRSYYYGHTSIARLSGKICRHLNPEGFEEYLDEFGTDAAKEIADSFASEITGITASNASQKTADLFKTIIIEASKKKRGRMGKEKEEAADEIVYEAEPELAAEEQKGSATIIQHADVVQTGAHSTALTINGTATINL